MIVPGDMFVRVFVGMAVVVMRGFMIIVSEFDAGSHGYVGCRLRIEFTAEQQHNNRAE